MGTTVNLYDYVRLFVRDMGGLLLDDCIEEQKRAVGSLWNAENRLDPMDMIMG